MSEVEPNLEIDDRLTDHTEAKVARLNNAGMDWTDGNFIYGLAADWRERERCAVIFEVVWRHGIFSEWKVGLRPEGVPQEWSWMRMSKRFDAEQVSDLALEPRGGKIEGGHRYDCRIFARDFLGGMHEPVLASIGEEVSNLEDSFVRSIVRYHEYKFRAEVSAQEPSQPPRCAASDAAMQFVATLDMGVRCLALEVLCQR